MTDMYEMSKTGVVTLEAMKAARAKKEVQSEGKYVQQFKELLDYVFDYMIKNCQYDDIYFHESDVLQIVDQHQRAMKNLIDILVREGYKVFYEEDKVGIEWIKVSGWN